MFDSSNVLALKFLIFPPDFKISFIAIVIVRLCHTHSERCCFTKNMIWRRPMGSIRQPLNPGISSTKDTAYIQCVDGRESQIHKLWCLGLDNITREVHPTAQVEVVAGLVEDFTTNYLARKRRIILIIYQLYINGGVQFLGIPDFFGRSGLSFLLNLQAPAEPTCWINGETSNQKWGGRQFGP